MFKCWYAVRPWRSSGVFCILRGGIKQSIELAKRRRFHSVNIPGPSTNNGVSWPTAAQAKHSTTATFAGKSICLLVDPVHQPCAYSNRCDLLDRLCGVLDSVG